MQCRAYMPAMVAAARSKPDLLNFWFGALLPARTPRDIVERLDHEIVKALQMPEVKERIVKLGGEPTSLSPSEFDAHLKQEIETNAIIVRAVASRL
jgi:tripartite-type tricarboxylate transporter receptor subunit TctC